MPTTASEPHLYRKYRVPRVDGTALVQPELRCVGELLVRNRSLRGNDFQLAGSSRTQLALTARQQLVELARQYTAAYRDVELPDFSSATSILMSGHQPTLFHPGVWFKNMSLAALAKQHRAIGIHLLVDHDVTATPTIQVPSRDRGAARRVAIALDAARSARPFEEWEIRSESCFRAAGERIERLIAPITNEPILRQLWPDAVAAMAHRRNLGQAVSQARHMLESRWQLQTLELPVSQLADTDSFRCFLAHLLVHADEFRQIHNDEVLRYRAAHHIRSQAHPVPLLRELDGWVELPYWSWTAAASRQPLFVQLGATIKMRAGPQGDVLYGPANPAHIVDWLTQLRREGMKIRPRALTNTMYARLILSDLFLHGIGGAKYDELGDAICRQFFGVEPPEFMTLSATVLLSVGQSQVDADDVRQLDGQLRDLWYHPERHLANSRQVSPSDQHLSEQKRELLVSPPPRGNRKQWHHRIVQITQLLRPAVAEIRQLLLDERAQLVEQLRSESVIRWREYSLALFQENRLKKVLLDLCGSSL